MTHEDASHYAAKHPGVKLNEKIAIRLRKKIFKKTISCAEAHRIADELNIDPSEAVVAIDRGAKIRKYGNYLSCFRVDNY